MTYFKKIKKKRRNVKGQQVYWDLKTWVDARHKCQTLGGDLLINFDKKKEDVIFEYINIGVFWIGLNDRGNEGSFIWLDDPQKVRPSTRNYYPEH
ncbi:hypothetical protein RRG08_002130 [Elysia crispata]|uniref:C-type lectin domain-containing protein n=1 Tax=Elysia crispata TaxID=231223 RepID=A0AAE0YT52_9GAST|nr:hypothetical protein RRG08_002130 [Elysia crispata]